MKRYPAFDPPEYVSWSSDPELAERYRRDLESDPDRARELQGLDEGGLLTLYRDLLRTRQEYIESVSELLEARARLELAVGGELP